MQRWTALVFLAVVAGAVGALVVGRRPGEGVAAGEPGSNLATSASLGLRDLPAPTGAATIRPLPTEPTPLPVASELPPLDAAALGASRLPPSAPRTVTFGVVLVAYRGAQGASADARSHDEARTLAEKVSAKGATDFAGAVKLGDLGFEDAGEMPREVLEREVEAVLFSLKPGEVSAPVDSPRGYYVFRRIE